MQQAVKIPVILGLGKTGLSCAKHLARQNIQFAVTDSREQPPGLQEFIDLFPQAKLSLGKFDSELLFNASEVIVSQGVPLKEPILQECQQRGTPLIGDVELFARAIAGSKAKVVAITGSNAKSTVTSLVAEIVTTAGLNAKVGGNIGTPVLDLIADELVDWYILEVSNFQLEVTSSLQAQVATVLNISPDHMDCYDCFADYVAAKQRVYTNCHTAIINKDDPLTKVQTANPKTILSFTADTPQANEFGLRQQGDQYYLAHGEELLCATDELGLFGRLNWLNALSALAIGFAMGIEFAPMLQALKSFKGLPHRCEKIAEVDGVKWYNDSKGTNVGATLAAILGIGSQIQGKIILLAGGLSKGADFTPLANAAENYTKSVLLFGKDAELLQQAFHGKVSDLVNTADLASAVQLAKTKANPGDVVLLSPACSSFDMFANFEKRGEVYTQLVHEVLQQNDE